MFLSKLAKTALISTLATTLTYSTITDTSIKTPKLAKVVQTKQYRANNPIEDRICVSELEQMKGILVAVFDGHGGDLCADYLAGNLPAFFEGSFRRLGGFGKMGAPKRFLTQVMEQCYDDLENGFKAIFEQNITDQRYQRVGACALTALITPRLVVVANSGDCQGVFLGGKQPVKTNQRLNAGQPQQQIRLKKQFPNEPDIYKCVMMTNYCYVKGRLQPTRSFGDFYLKNPQHNFTNLSTFTGPYITHKPKITLFQLTPQLGKSLILATDGLWDQLTQHQMNTLINPFHGSTQTAEILFEGAIEKILKRNRIKNFEILDEIANRRNLHDDVSVVVVDIDGFMGKYAGAGFPWYREEEEAGKEGKEGK